MHIGKTGGSAIKSVLNDFLETPKYSITLHGHGTSLEDIPKGDSVIFFLRDPVTRFVSGFYSRQRKGQPRYYSEWSPKEKEVFEHFSTPNEVAVSLANEQESAIIAMKSVQHFSRYKKWYVDFDYFKSRVEDILLIGFQESLDSDFERLKSILGIPEEINLPVDDVAAHKNPKNVDKSIDENGIEALKKWYSEDAKFIELCKEIMS
ncbi:MAG: sulfotransferase family 2 domain-containing protein, partial [Gammaproteobacteria bacterium]|nr:sulfotransferase family 2 domain-containing protein [Gammaproteobacteria bacterium]